MAMAMALAMAMAAASSSNLGRLLSRSLSSHIRPRSSPLLLHNQRPLFHRSALSSPPCTPELPGFHSVLLVLRPRVMGIQLNVGLSGGMRGHARSHDFSAPMMRLKLTGLVLSRDQSVSLPWSKHMSYSTETTSRDSSKDTERLNAPREESISTQRSNDTHDENASPFRQIMGSVATAPVVPMSLGIAGAVPFIVLTPPFPSFLPLPDVLSSLPLEAQAAYGAVILSFLGGPHWGLAMVGINESLNHKVFNFTIISIRYMWSVIPSLLAWTALLMPPILKLCCLISSFGLVLVVDTLFMRHGLTPLWYLALRLLLSAIAILCLISSMLEALMIQKVESSNQKSKGENDLFTSK